MNLTQDIHPLTDFKRNTVEIVKQLKESKRPMVLTVNGKPELVVQDAQSYQNVLDRLDELEMIEAIQLGMRDAAEGRVRPAREALENLRERLGIPR